MINESTQFKALIDQRNFDAFGGEISGDGGARHACADDANVEFWLHTKPPGYEFFNLRCFINYP